MQRRKPALLMPAAALLGALIAALLLAACGSSGSSGAATTITQVASAGGAPGGATGASPAPGSSSSGGGSPAPGSASVPIAPPSAGSGGAPPSAGTATTPTAGQKVRAGALRECLVKHGVEIPTTGAGALSKIPREKLIKALRECAPLNLHISGPPKPKPFVPPSVPQAPAKASPLSASFKTCMRQHGVNVGQGNKANPYAGIDTRSPQFQKALGACYGTLTRLVNPSGG